VPNGQWSGTLPDTARCIGCGKEQTSVYPGGWARSQGLGILLLDRARCVGVCNSCNTPATVSAYWQATIPGRLAVVK